MKCAEDDGSEVHPYGTHHTQTIKCIAFLWRDLESHPRYMLYMRKEVVKWMLLIVK